MRAVFLGFVIVFLSIAAFSQKKNTDLEFERLKGKVKSVRESSMYLGKKNKPERSPKREYYSTTVYSPDGNIAEEVHVERGIRYVYQFVDGFLSMRDVAVDISKSRGIRSKAIGNAEDMEKPVKTIKPDERFITRYDDEYDESGRRTLRRIFFSDGQMDSLTLYSYNAAGFLEQEIYNTYGNKWSHSYSYDAAGNLKVKTTKRSNVNDVVDMTDRTEYSDYKFDADGNWIERRQTNHHEYNGSSSSTSEEIHYRDIKYYPADRPKKKAVGKNEK